MAFAGLNNWFKKRLEQARDVVDANTPADYARRQQQQFKGVPYRMAAPQSYQDQQRALGNIRPNQNIGQALLGNTIRLGNTAKAGIGGVVGLNQIALSSILGSDEDYTKTVKGVDRTLKRDLSPTGGLFNAGTFFDSAEQAKNVSAGDLTKKIGAGGVGVYGEVGPAQFGRATQGANLGARALRAGIEGAAVGAAGAAGDEFIRTGKVTPQNIGMGAAFGGIVGGATPIAGVAGTRGKQAFDNRTPLNEIGAVGKNVNQPEGRTSLTPQTSPLKISRTPELPASPSAPKGIKVGRTVPETQTTLPITLPPKDTPTPIKVKGAMSDADYLKRYGKERAGQSIKVKPFKAEDYAFENWQDRNPLGLGRETLDRNIDRVAGADAPKLKQFLVDASRKNETDRAVFLNTLRQQTRSDIVDNLGIKPKSQESALVQRYGEGLIDDAELQKLAGNAAPNIKQAAQYFRNQYDTLLDQWNAVRSRYGYDPVPKRQDYFRHFQEIESGGNLLGIIKNAKDLPTNISGITDIFRPNKPFSTAEMRRLGSDTAQDAVSGFDNYLDAVSRQIYHLDTVQRGRSVENAIRKAAESNPEIELPNFVANLGDWTNMVSGKKSRVDRAAEQVVGRKVYTIAQIARARTGANMVGANLSSAFTNYIPFTQSLATTSKPAAVKGMMSSLFSPFQKAPDVIDGVRSGFLTRRFVKDSIKETGVRRAAEVASKPFEFVDQFTSRSIVAGKYYENLAKGLNPQQAMKAADDYASKVITDRSVGQLPNLMETRTAGFLTQFQAEVNNQVSFLMRDIPEFANGNPAKIASALSQFIIFSYLFNTGYEKVMGRRPQIDPIQAGIDIYSASEQDNGKTPGENAIKATPQALKENIAQGLPFSSLFTGGRLPVNAMMPDLNAIGKGISNIGTDQPVLPQLYKGISGPLYYGVPPFGGGQIRKTAEGLYATSKGESVSPSGKQRFTIDQNPLNVAKAGIFGQYATNEGTQYIKGLNDNLAGKSGTLKLNNTVTQNGKDVSIADLPLSQRIDKLIEKDKPIDENLVKQTIGEIAPQLQGFKINELGDIPITTRTAKLWSDYQQKVEGGKISAVEAAGEKRKLQRELYRTTLPTIARDLLGTGVSDADIVAALESGTVDQATFEKALDLDSKFVKAGLASNPQIGNKIRELLGYDKVYAPGKEPKGRTRYARGGRKGRGGGRGGRGTKLRIPSSSEVLPKNYVQGLKVKTYRAPSGGLRIAPAKQSARKTPIRIAKQAKKIKKA